jgi:hypothetical protein
MSHRAFVAGALLVVVALAAAFGFHALASSASPAGLFRVVEGHDSTLGEADGAIPDGTTVFDDHVPGVARLEPALLAALRRAGTDARRDGIELDVDSGWRSSAYQDRLLHDAVARYGSADEAARWVAPPQRSEHVSGNAVDLAHADATRWLAQRGAAYGLCQVYENEPWHFELRPEAAQHGCPPEYADPTHDPRMQP